MKKFISYFSAVILGVMILAVSPGVSIYKMQCLSGNFSSTSFYAPVDCSEGNVNKDIANHGILSSRCCDFSYDYLQLKVLSHFNVTSAPIPQVLGLVCDFVQQFNLVQVVSTSSESFLNISSSPPLCSDILHLIGVMLI